MNPSGTPPLSRIRRATQRLQSATQRLRYGSSRLQSAFTLMELLVVIGVMALMMALIGPAVRGIKGAQDLTSASENIASVLDQARTYAMANDTHVFVGFTEVNANNTSASKLQQPGIGKIVMGVVSSKDGSNIYGSTPSNWQQSLSLTGSASVSGSLVAISAVQSFQNVHMSRIALGSPGANGSMMLGSTSRPEVSGTLQIGNTQGFQSWDEFYWPVGLTTSKSNYQYDFQAVLEFDPEGGVLYQSRDLQAAPTTRYQYFELGIQPTNGSAISTGSNCAVIQIDGVTGINHIYRP